MPISHKNYNLPDSPFTKLFFMRPQPRKVFHNNLVKIMFVDIMMIIFLIVITYLCDIFIKHVTQDNRRYVIIDGIPYDYYDTDSTSSDSDTDDEEEFDTANSDDD